MLNYSGNTAAFTRLLAVFLFAAQFLGGCAAPPRQQGGAWSGSELNRFSVPGGESGSLRSQNGKYFLALDKSGRVIPIDDAIYANFIRADNVGGRTLVVLGVREQKCSYKTTVYSFKDNQASSWDLGNCNLAPVINITPNAAYFDYLDRDKKVRYVYHDDRVDRSVFPPGVDLPSPNRHYAGPPLSVESIGASSPRYRPSPPIDVVPSGDGRADEAVKASTKSPVSGRPASQRDTESTSALPKTQVIVLPARNTTAIEIDLMGEGKK